MKNRAWKCKCGDPACNLWRDDVVCPHCSSVLSAICADPEFEGRAGDMGEGHYVDCLHGAISTPHSASPVPPTTRRSCPTCGVPFVNAECPKCGDRDCWPTVTRPQRSDHDITENQIEMAKQLVLIETAKQFVLEFLTKNSDYSYSLGDVVLMGANQRGFSPDLLRGAMAVLVDEGRVHLREDLRIQAKLDDLDRLETLAQHITPRPWKFGPRNDPNAPGSISTDNLNRMVIAVSPRLGFTQFKADAAFICALVNAFDSLITRIRKSESLYVEACGERDALAMRPSDYDDVVRGRDEARRYIDYVERDLVIARLRIDELEQAYSDAAARYNGAMSRREQETGVAQESLGRLPLYIPVEPSPPIDTTELKTSGPQWKDGGFFLPLE